MFQLDPKSRKSIYEQVIDNLKELIMTGRLKAGDKLPSVRDLSKMITVNPNTIQKAYRELERQGYTYTQSGLGTFVSDKKEITIDPNEYERAVKRLGDCFNQLFYMGLKENEIDEIVLNLKKSIFNSQNRGSEAEIQNEGEK